MYTLTNGVKHIHRYIPPQGLTRVTFCEDSCSVFGFGAACEDQQSKLAKLAKGLARRIDPTVAGADSARKHATKNCKSRLASTVPGSSVRNDMIVPRLFGEQSRFISFCVGRNDRFLAITSKVYSDEHVRLHSTVSGNHSSLDTQVILQNFVNYEQQGVPDSAGTSGNKVFDLVRTSYSPA